MASGAKLAPEAIAVDCFDKPRPQVEPPTHVVFVNPVEETRRAHVVLRKRGFQSALTHVQARFSLVPFRKTHVSFESGARDGSLTHVQTAKPCLFVPLTHVLWRIGGGVGTTTHVFALFSPEAARLAGRWAARSRGA